MNHPTQLVRRAMALLSASAALIGTVAVNAQTVFTATGITTASTGATTTIAATSSDPLYNNFSSGPAANNITPVTFGNGFTMTAPGPDAGIYNNSFIIGGTITGGSVSAGTVMPISYNFSLAKNATSAFTGTGIVTWTLSFSDSVNTSSQQIATGSFGGLSSTFSGSGTDYIFTSGVSPGATFIATLNATYNGNNPMIASVLTGTMLNAGYGGTGITLNASAIPEPSTYAAIAGAAMLGFAVWSRRRRSATGA